MGVIRIFLLVEAASFVLASMIHGGLLIDGYAHPRARIAEGVIAAVLLAGLVLSWLLPDRLRGIGLAAQGIALVGTLIGILTVIVGIGPRTTPDIVYHISILLLLVWGLVVAARYPA